MGFLSRLRDEQPALSAPEFCRKEQAIALLANSKDATQNGERSVAIPIDVVETVMNIKRTDITEAGAVQQRLTDELGMRGCSDSNANVIFSLDTPTKTHNLEARAGMLAYEAQRMTPKDLTKAIFTPEHETIKSLHDKQKDLHTALTQSKWL